MNNSNQFKELIGQHKGILFKVARTYCQDDDDRQDLVQEMMIQIWKSFQGYDDSYKISTWLYRICLNVAISFYRKNAARKASYMPLHEQITSPPDEDLPEKELQLKALERFIGELQDLDKALILLYLEDKSHAEISDILGISVSNVSTKVGRIKTKLKQRFSQQNI